MSQIQDGSEATAAALVGSLATFSLFDVLEMLARTGRTGELQVVGRAVDQRVWVDRGDLLDPSGEGTRSSALFELACIEEGWFYFTVAPAAPEGQARVPVTSVLADLGPQVVEWRNLVAFLPFDSRVAMSSSTPGPAVQIRADQWQMLSLVGSSGRTVRSVVDTAETHPLDTLRTLRELVDAQLIAISDAPSPFSHAPTADLYTGDTGSGPGPDTGSQPADTHEAPAHGPLSAASAWSGPGDAESPPVPERVPPAPQGYVERDDTTDTTDTTETTGRTEPDEGAEVAESPEHVEDEVVDDTPVPEKTETVSASAMPPPITGDPWSSPPSRS